MAVQIDAAGIRAAQQACAAPREKRVQIFREKVDWLEEQHTPNGYFWWHEQTCTRSKPCTPHARCENLTPILISDLQLGLVHKGRVLHCTTVVKCGLWSAVSALVEDSAKTLSNFAVYNVPNVVSIWDAQAWLPEGTSFAIVEPYFKTRSDGTPGIRVDNPDDIIFNAKLAGLVAPDGHSSLAASDKFKIGSRIRVCALQSDSGRLLNGLNGIVQSYDERAGRFGVDIDGIGTKALKPGNMIHCDADISGEDCDMRHDATPIDQTKKKRNKKKKRQSGREPIEPAQDAASTTNVAISSLHSFIAPATRVTIVGLTSDAGILLNGLEGIVEGHDLTKGRIRVQVPKVGMKALKSENMTVLHEPRAALPRPCADVPSIEKLCEQGKWVEALVLGQCKDHAYISHTMHPLVRTWLFQKPSEDKCEAVVQIISAMVEAASEAQLRDPTTGPNTFHEPSSLLKLCDKAVNSLPKSEDQTPLLFLRGTIWSSVHDFHAAASDFRAAYVISGGACPWILSRAGWATVSANDGVPASIVLQNDAEAQLMYEVLQQHLYDQKDESPQELHSLRVFCSWELAEVMIWGRSRSRVLEGQRPLPPSPEFKDSIFRLKDQALKAEKNIRGVMNSLARDDVLRFCSLYQGPLAEPHDNRTPSVPAVSKLVRQAVVESGAESSLFPNLGAYIEMEENETRRMNQHADARREEDIFKAFHLMHEESAKDRMAAERGFLERRKVLDSRAEQLAAQEEAFKQREARLREQREAVKREAAKLKGDDEAMRNLYKRERERQAEEFKAQMSQMSQQYEEEIHGIRSQLREISRQREEEHLALLESKRLAEKALEEVVGATGAEMDRWQQEICDREDQLSSEQASLKLQAEQLAQMQADLSERAQVLEERDRVLKIESKAQQELQANGSLSQQELGEQTSGGRKMCVHEIRFSQDSISSCFSDGRSTQELTKNLESGQTSIADIPTIRVVHWGGIFWSLDNRRLRCMQTAFAKERKKMIDVQLESLKHEKIHKEFLRKFTTGKDIVQRQPRHDRR